MPHSKVPVISEAPLLPKVQRLKNSGDSARDLPSVRAPQTAPPAEKVVWPPTSILRRAMETQPWATQQQPASSQVTASQKQRLRTEATRTQWFPQFPHYYALHSSQAPLFQPLSINLLFLKPCCTKPEYASLGRFQCCAQSYTPESSAHSSR